MAGAEIILSYNDSLLRRSDVMLIQNNDWINDSVITFWFEYLTHAKYQAYESRVSLISPEVTQFIKSADSNNSDTKSVVLSVLQSMSLMDKDLILMPLNDHSSRSLTSGGSHWTLITIIRNTIVPNTFSFHHLDSLASGSNEHAAAQIYRVLQNILPFDPVSILNMDCTMQINSYDCGIHVMVNADALCQHVLQNDSRSVQLIAGPQSVRQMRPFLLQLIQDLRSKAPSET